MVASSLKRLEKVILSTSCMVHHPSQLDIGGQHRHWGSDGRHRHWDIGGRHHPQLHLLPNPMAQMFHPIPHCSMLDPTSRPTLHSMLDPTSRPTLHPMPRNLHPWQVWILGKDEREGDHNRRVSNENISHSYICKAHGMHTQIYNPKYGLSKRQEINLCSCVMSCRCETRLAAS